MRNVRSVLKCLLCGFVNGCDVSFSCMLPTSYDGAGSSSNTAIRSIVPLCCKHAHMSKSYLLHRQSRGFIFV